MARPFVRRGHCLVLMSAFCIQLAGCGGPAAPKREYADVSGTVKYNGKPVTKGSVVFQPASGAAVIGELKEDGSYTLKGVIGSNTVMINNPTPQMPSAVSDDIAKNKAAMAQNEEAAKAAKTVPDNYATSKSGLTFDVKPGTNKADFDLK
jgi:hypothetical protein